MKYLNELLKNRDHQKLDVSQKPVKLFCASGGKCTEEMLNYK